MGFDTNRFDIDGFDVSGGMYRYIKAVGQENVSAVIGSGMNRSFLAIGYERVATPIMAGIQGLALAASGAETIGEYVGNALGAINLKPHFAEIVDADTALGAEIGLTPEGAETIAESAILGADIALSIAGAETVGADTVLGADIAFQLEGFELISAAATSEAVETKTCVLNITLRPGQRLIIDANNYNVLLDGENAIYIQSGDWIDELIRNTTALDISAASGSANISATILYTERFL